MSWSTIPEGVRLWLVAVVIGVLGGGCLLGCKQQNVEVLDQYLTSLNKHGVTYSFHVTGPLDAGFELYTGGRVTTGGWIDLQVQSATMNPLFEPVFPTAPVR